MMPTCLCLEATDFSKGGAPVSSLHAFRTLKLLFNQFECFLKSLLLSRLLFDIRSLSARERASGVLNLLFVFCSPVNHFGSTSLKNGIYSTKAKRVSTQENEPLARIVFWA